MNLMKSARTSGKDHYRLLYQSELEKEAEWLRRGAGHKVNSIELLLSRNSIKPKTLLELGCGTGAVITECQRRNLSERYVAVDYAPEAIDYLRKHSTGIEPIQGDITDPTFRLNRPCDVVILSHVLEHLEDPAGFLAALRSSLKFTHAIIEVPLEDLAISKLKAVLKDRRASKAGHVQFFTPHTLEHLLKASGFRISDTRRYIPVLDMETIRFACDKNRMGRRQRFLMACTGNYLPRMLNPLWQRLYYAHYAVLCK